MLSEARIRLHCYPYPRRMMVAVAQVAAAPWWGAPLIAALALIAGAALTLAGTHWRASTELKRKDQTRWDDIILETAVEVEAICAELASLGRYGWPHYISDPEARTVKYVELVDRLNEARSKFRLVASDRLKEESMNLFGTALNEFLGQGAKPVVDFETARIAFVAEVRRELRAN